MVLALVPFLQLAASCAPAVAPETLAAVVATESGFNPLVIYDNTTERALHPATLQEAVATATALISAGHSLDIGLGQINSGVNLASRGIGVAEAFDPCTNLRVSAQVLVEGYSACRLGDAQGCIGQALSRYNTGDPSRGFANGYVQRVQASAGQIVPAIRAAGDTAAPAPPSTPPRPAAPSWDVWGSAGASIEPPVAPPEPAGRPRTAPVVMLQGLVAERTEQ